MTSAGKSEMTGHFRTSLLEWYDRHRRVLPWRAPPGQRTAPYAVWLSEIMLQQTTVAAVTPYFLKFMERWPTVGSLATADDADIMNAWAGLGYYSRARNLLKCARVVVERHGGVFPSQAAELKNLPGIGDYTAAAIAAIAFDRPASVVDGNVERVISRVFALQTPLPALKKEIRSYVDILSEGQLDRPGDFAQAMMDLGATICVPRNPRCILCPLQDLCAARRQGIQNELPRRVEKQARPKRTGYAYWITGGHGRVMLHRRPDSGLLGGMAALPTSEWAGPGSEIDHPAFIQEAVGATHKILGHAKIKHVFTHFELNLTPVIICWPDDKPLPDGHYWAEASAVNDWGLPSVFKKAARMMMKEYGG